LATGVGTATAIAPRAVTTMRIEPNSFFFNVTLLEPASYGRQTQNALFGQQKL
jgi:hypothetical protein